MPKNTPPQTPEEFEELIRRVGDKAMKKVLKQYAARKENSAKENLSAPANVCFYCRENLDERVCKHWVATLCDDSECSSRDAVTPLYFTWLEHCSESQEEMIGLLDGYFETLCALCDHVVNEGPNERERIQNEAIDLPQSEKTLLAEGIKLLGSPDAREDYETTEYLLSELGPQMKDVFNELFLRYGGKRNKGDWTIHNLAGAWNSTHYCAEERDECVASVILECRRAIDRLRRLIHEP